MQLNKTRKINCFTYNSLWSIYVYKFSLKSDFSKQTNLHTESWIINPIENGKIIISYYLIWYKLYCSAIKIQSNSKTRKYKDRNVFFFSKHLLICKYKNFSKLFLVMWFTYIFIHFFSYMRFARTLVRFNPHRSKDLVLFCSIRENVATR